MQAPCSVLTAVGVLARAKAQNRAVASLFRTHTHARTHTHTKNTLLLALSFRAFPPPVTPLKLPLLGMDAPPPPPSDFSTDTEAAMGEMEAIETDFVDPNPPGPPGDISMLSMLGPPAIDISSMLCGNVGVWV